ncbi:MAG TPA: PadR family transcriptional regulator [Vicinamibacterales bacterium]|nr:PadR family transcriptional regulator [Vicinamibacterales bacterium]
MGRATTRQDLLPGTLDMLILKSLTRGVMHGYGIVEHIRTLSAEVLSVEEGSLYPALQRLQLQGLVASEWGHSVNNRRARYYRLTAAGRKQLGQVESSFERLIGAIRRVMKPVRGPAAAPDPKTSDGSAASRALRRAPAPRRG